MLAKINGLFRLTRDAELSYGNNQKAIVKLGLVCSEKYKGKENTLFIDATAFGGLGETINTYSGNKGNQIYLSGKIQTELWQDKEGQKKSKISMIVEDFDFVSNNKSYNQSGGHRQQPQQEQNGMTPSYGAENNQGAAYTPVGASKANQNYQDSLPQNKPAEDTTKQSIPEYDIDEDEIPF